MSKILIDPKDQKEEALILEFLKKQKIKARIIGDYKENEEAENKEQSSKVKSSHQYTVLSEILNQYANPQLFQDIDPVKWQRNLRDEWE